MNRYEKLTHPANERLRLDIGTYDEQWQDIDGLDLILTMSVEDNTTIDAILELSLEAVKLVGVIGLTQLFYRRNPGYHSWQDERPLALDKDDLLDPGLSPLTVDIGQHRIAWSVKGGEDSVITFTMAEAPVEYAIEQLYTALVLLGVNGLKTLYYLRNP